VPELDADRGLPGEDDLGGEGAVTTVRFGRLSTGYR